MKRLNTRGFTHWIVPAFVFIIIGGIGAHLLVESHAATPPAPLADWSSINGNLTVVNNHFGTSLVGHNVCAYIASILYHGYDPDPSDASGHYHGLPASGAGTLWGKYPSLRYAANYASMIPAGAFVFYANTSGTVVHVVVSTGYNNTYGPLAYSRVGIDNDGYLTEVNGPNSPEKLWNYHIIGWMNPSAFMRGYGSYTSHGSVTTYYNAFLNLKNDSSWR